MNVLGKYLDMKKKPKKLPNIVSLVVYHGERAYPFAKDVFSCFEDEGLAKQDILEPMVLLDLSQASIAEIIGQGGSDAVLKLLLKWGQERDFINKLQKLMSLNPEIFVSLSAQQAGFMYDYVMLVGKGTRKNAEIMDTALQQVFGEKKAKAIFSLADFYREEGIQKGIQQGMEKGIEAIKDLLAKGIMDEAQAKKAIKAIQQKLKK